MWDVADFLQFIAIILQIASVGSAALGAYLKTSLDSQAKIATWIEDVSRFLDQRTPWHFFLQLLLLGCFMYIYTWLMYGFAVGEWDPLNSSESAPHWFTVSILGFSFFCGIASITLMAKAPTWANNLHRYLQIAAMVFALGTIVQLAAFLMKN